jgi:hypothetical protein
MQAHYHDNCFFFKYFVSSAPALRANMKQLLWKIEMPTSGVLLTTYSVSYFFTSKFYKLLLCFSAKSSNFDTFMCI